LGKFAAKKSRVAAASSSYLTDCLHIGMGLGPDASLVRAVATDQSGDLRVPGERSLV
jgi:hypothetical protein